MPFIERLDDRLLLVVVVVVVFDRAKVEGRRDRISASVDRSASRSSASS